MAVTACSDDNYVLIIADGGGTHSLRVAYGMSSLDLFTLNSEGVMTLTNELKAENTISLEYRGSGSLVEFRTSGNAAVASIDSDGRFTCSGSRGVAVKVETSAPGDTPTAGTIRALIDTTPHPDEYSLIGYVGGTWKKLSLPN